MIFNRVCTAQYFLWYEAFYTLIVPSNKVFTSMYYFFGLKVLWVVFEMAVNYFNYQVEFNGLSEFVGMFYATHIFLIINVLIIVVFIKNQPFRETIQERVGKVE